VSLETPDTSQFDFEEEEEESASPFSIDPLHFLRILYIRKWIILEIGLFFLILTTIAGSTIKKSEYRTYFRLLNRNPLRQMTMVEDAEQYNVASPQTLLEMITMDTIMEEVADSLYHAVEARDIKKNFDIRASRSNDEIISCSLTLNNKDLVIRAANILAHIAQRKTAEFQREAGRQAMHFYEKRIQETEANLDSLEVSVKEFKQKYGIVNFDAEVSAVSSDKQRLEQDLRAAQSELNAINIQIKSIQSELSIQPEESIGSTTYFSPIRNRIAELKAQLSEIRLRYTDDNPKVVKIQNQIAELERRLEEEGDDLTIQQSYQPNPARVSFQLHLQSLDSQKKIIADKIDGILIQQKLLEDDLALLPEIQQEYENLMRRRSILDQLYVRLLDLRGGSQLIAETERGYFEILEPAIHARLMPSKKKLVMVSGIFLGLGFGFAFFIALEFLDDSIKSSSDINRLLKLDPLGEIPIFKNQAALIDPSDLGASITEVYRLILSNIYTASYPQSLRVLGVTCASKYENKTVVATNLAISATLQGKRVVLIDTDIRGYDTETRMHPFLRKDRKSKGLINYLTDEMEIEDILLPTSLKNLRRIHAGPYHTSYIELLRSKRMDQLLAELKQMCDLVIIDMPAMIPRVDVVFVADKVDCTALVCDFKEVSSKIIKEGTRRLTSNNCKILGGILNQVEDLYRNRYYNFDNELSYRNIPKTIEVKFKSILSEIKAMIWK